MRDVIPFRAAGAACPSTAHTPDVAVAALPFFRGLRDTLTRAAAFRDAMAARRWGVPRLFFFDRAAQAAWAAEQSTNHAVRSRSDRTTLDRIARRMPDAAQAWDDLADLAADALALLGGSVEVRRAARAVPGLQAAAAALAPDHSACRQVAGVLAVPDDWVVLALHPAARAGFRVRLRGVADLFQFHVLFADAVAGSPARGFLPGPRPDPRIVEAYRDSPIDPDADVVEARFQLYRPAALRSDGTLPVGFRGADDWLWGHESPADIPAVNGERVVLLGDPPYPRTWPVGRRWLLVHGELDLLDVLTPAAVESWLHTLTGQEPARDAVRRAA